MVSYAIVGAGAMGSILGAHLARAGHDIVMVARGARAGQLRRDGIRLEGLSDFTTSVQVVADPARLQAARTLILATKTPGTHETLQTLRHVRVDAALSIQNGVQKDELLAAVFGRERTLGALADISGELHRDGRVSFTRNVNVLIGELSGGRSARCAEIAHELAAAGVRATEVPDIVSLEWSKFVSWVGWVTFSVLTRAETWKFLDDPDCAVLLVRMTEEMRRLATAAGIPISDESLFPVATMGSLTEDQSVERIRAIGRQLQATAPHHRMSSLQDFEAGRPLEIHETIGYALAEGRRLNVPMDLTANFYRALAAIDRIGRR